MPFIGLGNFVTGIRAPFVSNPPFATTQWELVTLNWENITDNWN